MEVHKEILGNKTKEDSVNKRKVKVFGELRSIFENNPDMDSNNLDLLTVSEEDYQKKIYKSSRYAAL